MGIVPIAASVFSGLAVGAGGIALIAAGKLADLRSAIAVLNEHHAADAKQHQADQTEITKLGNRCTELRVEGRNKDSSIDALKQRVAELEPLADAHREYVAKCGANLKKAQEANKLRNAKKAVDRAVQAEADARRKQAGNVTPITKPAATITAPKKPTRKSALAG